MQQASVEWNKIQAGTMHTTMEKYVGRLMSDPVLKKAVQHVFGGDRVVTWAHWFAGCNAVSCALNHSIRQDTMLYYKLRAENLVCKAVAARTVVILPAERT